jgi:hypothetical protein
MWASLGRAFPTCRTGATTVAYEDLVRTFWRTYRPSEVDKMPTNKALEDFARDRSAEIVEAIDDLTAEWAPPLKEGTDVVERAHELKSVKMRARERVLQEMVYGMQKEPGTETLDMPRVELPAL